MSGHSPISEPPQVKTRLVPGVAACRNAMPVKPIMAAVSLAAVAVASTTLAGCSGLFRERTCAGGEHPVWSTEYPETGGACVPDGSKPPAWL
jgi:hypothetical protein